MRNPGIPSRVRAWLNNIPLKDPVDRRMAALLQVILIGFMTIIVIASGVNLVIAKEIPWQVNVFRSSIAILIIGVPLVLLRRGHFRGSARILLSIFLILETYAATISSLREVAETLSIFTLGIVLAGLLIGRRALVLAFTWCAGVVVFSAFREQSAGLGDDGIVIAGNFILLNGLMGLFIDRFGVTLRNALSSALERENELQNQIDERMRADKALRESEERYRKLIDHARDVIFTISAEGKITSLNPSFEAFTGWPREEWLGRTFEELILQEDIPLARDRFKRILLGQTLRALRLHMPIRTGEILVVEMSISPQIRDGDVVGLLGIARDMTEEQRALDALEANEKRFRALVEHGVDQISLLGADGTLIYENPTTRQPLGYPRGTFVGRNLFELVHPDDQRRAGQTWDTLLGEPGSSLHTAFRLQHADGTYRWIEGTATNLLDEPAVEAVVINYRDVTERIRTEEALRASENFRRLIVENEPECVKLVSPKGALIEMNPAGLRMIEADSLEQVKNAPVIDLVAPEHQAAFNDLLERVMNGESGALEFEIIGLKGTRRWLETRAVPLYKGSKQIEALLGVTRDITEYKQAEEALRRQAHRLKALREIDTAILAADSVENIVHAALSHIRVLVGCRRASLELLDRETREVVLFDVEAENETFMPKGTRVPTDISQDMIPILAENQPVLINDLTTLPNLPRQFREGIKEGFRSVCILPLMSQSNLIGMFSLSSETPSFFDEEKVNLGREVANQVAIGITQSRLVEQLQHLNANLEQRVKERTDQLEAALKESDAANKELDAFSYSVSHDLRAPLRAIDGFSQIVMENYAPQLPEEAQHYLDRVRNGSLRMGQLIDDLLQLSRVTRQAPKYEIVNLSEVADQIASELITREPPRSVEWIIADGLVTRGDPGLLRIMLENLLDNARKFTAKQEQARIEFGSTLQRDGTMAYFVRDNGVGFDMAYAGKLFGAFQRLHTETEFEGTGVGLATVSRIVARHGGMVWAEADLGEGATFYFSL